VQNLKKIKKMSNNPKLIKNGGSGTTAGNLIRGILKVGGIVSPELKGVIGLFLKDKGKNGTGGIINQLGKEGFSKEQYDFLLAGLKRDEAEMESITRRWEADSNSDSWAAKNVRQYTLWLYNISILLLVFLDSSVDGFIVRDLWMTILLGNSGMINTAYFGSRYLQKRDEKKYK